MELSKSQLWSSCCVETGLSLGGTIGQCLALIQGERFSVSTNALIKTINSRELRRRSTPVETRTRYYLDGPIG